MDRCPHCMTHTTAQICPSCGRSTHWQAPSNQLPVGTLLRSSGDHVYQLGAAKGQGGFGITYAAMDLRTNTRVAVKEYFPSHCAGRDAMTRVLCSTGQRDSFETGLRSFLRRPRPCPPWAPWTLWSAFGTSSRATALLISSWSMWTAMP